MAEAIIYTIFAIFAVYGMYTAARETVLFISRLRGKNTGGGCTLCGGCTGCSMRDDAKEECPRMPDVKEDESDSVEDEEDKDFFPT